MDWDDNFDDWHDEWDSSPNGSSPGTYVSKPEEPFDPTDIANPVSAYFFLSDDVQDEIINLRKRNIMTCRSCGHRFSGEFDESCPECYSIKIAEMV